jgi:hypothetical protein
MTVDAAPAKIGRSTIYVESTDTQIPATASTQSGEFGTSKTSTKLDDAYAQLKELLQEVSSDLGDAVAQSAAHGLTSVAVEFALAFTGEANVWVLKAGGQGSVKATLTWQIPQP